MYVCMYVCMYMCMYANTYIHTYTHNIHTYTGYLNHRMIAVVYTCKYVHKYINRVDACMHVYKYVLIPVNEKIEDAPNVVCVTHTRNVCEWVRV